MCSCRVYYWGIRKGKERGRRAEQNVTRNSDRRVNRSRSEYQRIRREELEARREASRVNHGSNRYPDLTLVVPVVAEMSVERLIPESRNPESQDGSGNIDNQYGPRNTDGSRTQDGQMDTERTPLLQEQNVPS